MCSISQLCTQFHFQTLTCLILFLSFLTCELKDLWVMNVKWVSIICYIILQFHGVGLQVCFVLIYIYTFNIFTCRTSRRAG